MAYWVSNGHVTDDVKDWEEDPENRMPVCAIVFTSNVQLLHGYKLMLYSAYQVPRRHFFTL